MGYEDHRHAEFVVDAHQQSLDQLDRHRVEPGERFVGQDDNRVSHERACQRHALDHTAGQFARFEVVNRVESDRMQAGANALFDLGLCQLPMLAERERDVLVDGHRVEQCAMLEHHAELASHPVQGSVAHPRDVLAVNQHPAPLRLHQTADQAQHRAFARSAAAQNDGDPPPRKGAGKALEYGTFAVRHVDVIEGYVGVADVGWVAQGAVRNAHRLQSSRRDVEIRSAQRVQEFCPPGSVVEQRGDGLGVVHRFVVSTGVVVLSGTRKLALRGRLQGADSYIFGVGRTDAASRVPKHERPRPLNGLTRAGRGVAGLGAAGACVLWRTCGQTDQCEKQSTEQSARQVRCRASQVAEFPRAAAIEALASMEIKMETFHQVVTPLLQDDFLEVRLSAVMALAQLPSAVQNHLEALGELIIDPDTVLREQALMALTHAGDGASVYQDQVAVLLADPSPGVRHAAMRVLGAMGETTPMAIAQITWLGQTGGQETLRHALDALGRMGEQAESALPLLRQSLQHEEASIRLSAFEGLMAVETGSEKRLPIMLKALEDRSTPMRHASMKALISLKEEAAPAIPVLIQRLSESEDRELALGALRVVPSQMTYLELYLQALSHDDPGVRAFGCRALGNLGAAAEKALPELRNMRRDRYRFVREQASEAIKQIEG